MKLLKNKQTNKQTNKHREIKIADAKSYIAVSRIT